MNRKTFDQINAEMPNFFMGIVASLVNTHGGELVVSRPTLDVITSEDWQQYSAYLLDTQDMGTLVLRYEPKP